MQEEPFYFSPDREMFFFWSRYKQKSVQH